MSKKKKCYSGIGGQAVLEGIMMKNKTRYSVAVRKPNGEIDVEISEYRGILGDSIIMKIPFLRGIFAFIDSMILGTRALNHSAAFFEEEDASAKKDTGINKAFKERMEHLMVVLVTIISVALAIGIFMILPYFISDRFLNVYVRNASAKAIIEGVIRLAIFILYVLSISLMKDIRRVYMFHGAEHKCINCIEKGRPLTVKNVMKSSKQHKRCGTSFLLFVMIISIILFFFIRVDQMYLKVLLRILLIPVIAGIAYEVIRIAGNSENIIVRILSAPGMWLQGLTTREPDEEMVEVAIKAVEAVFDWRAFQTEHFGKTFEEDTVKAVSDENTGKDASDEDTGKEASDEDAVKTAPDEDIAGVMPDDDDEPTFIGNDDDL